MPIGRLTCFSIKASHNLTEGAFKVSSTTIKIIGDAAAKLGDVMGKSMGIQSSYLPPSSSSPLTGTTGKPGGAPPVGYRGVLNRSLIAFNAITDSLEGSAKILLSSGEKTSTAVIGHTLGPDAAAMSYSVGSSFKRAYPFRQSKRETDRIKMSCWCILTREVSPGRRC